MERYLLFDSGCTACSNLAHEVEREFGDILIARSLRDPEMQQLLEQAKPNWKWEPTLLEVDSGDIRAYTNIKLRARLLSQLGLRRAWRAAKIVSNLIITPDVKNSGRRSFVQQGSALLFALALWPKQSKASASALQADGIVDSTPVEAQELAVLVEKAVNSPELQIISVAHAIDFSQYRAKAVRNTLSDNRQEIVVTFTDEMDNFLTYVERTEGYVRSKGEFWQAVDDGKYLLAAMAINGESTSLPEGGVILGNECAGCSWEQRSGCRPCGSTIRPTEEWCCVCTDWYGNSHVIFCNPYHIGGGLVVSAKITS